MNQWSSFKKTKVCATSKFNRVNVNVNGSGTRTYHLKTNALQILFSFTRIQDTLSRGLSATCNATPHRYDWNFLND